MPEQFLASLAIVADASFLMMLATGVVLGLSLGVLPGLGGSAGLAILLPFVYGMDPASALAMMVGLLAVTTTSDTFPAGTHGHPRHHGLASDCAGWLSNVQARRSHKSHLGGPRFVDFWWRCGRYSSDCSLTFCRTAFADDRLP